MKFSKVFERNYDKALINAVWKCNPRKVQGYIEKGANPSILDKDTPVIQLPFRLMKLGFHQPDKAKKIVSCLVVAGADLNAYEELYHYSTLSYALREGWVGLAQQMIDKGARINHLNTKKETPLHLIFKRITRIVYRQQNL